MRIGVITGVKNGVTVVVKVTEAAISVVTTIVGCTV
jgi:hypothetical protein